MSAGLVASPILTSKPQTNNQMDPNTIAREAVRLSAQSSADTKYDPIPEKRIEEPFRNYSKPAATVAIVIGLVLIAVGLLKK